ncbi:MAG TPA: MerR family transcriptional regulator [Bellilinea sp.]|nr:MerR family transcriptional regulator [Bellilinea sp.]
MDTAEELLIHELADQAGVSVRTIRYYISQGLLPAPDTKGRYATFNEEYRLRLELIRRLKEAFLPLKEIRDRIAGLDPAQIQALLDQLEGGNLNIHQEKNFVLSEPQNAPYEPKPLSSALDYLSQVMGMQGATRSRPKSNQLLPPPPVQPALRSPQQIETWQRIVLAPGVELNIRSSEEPYFRERIRQIIEFAKIQFS